MKRRQQKLPPSQVLGGDSFFKPKVQAKLAMGVPGDTYEVEADRMADQVVNKTGSGDAVQKMEGEEEVQQKPLAASVTPLIQKMDTSEEESPVQKMEEEEPVQAMEEEESVQKMEEEEPVQAMEEEEPVQKMEEEEPVQAMEEEEVQAKTADNTTTNANIEGKLRKGSGGSKMDATTQTEMESGFGADFSNVNIHTDSEAAQMSQDIGAQAFTHGNDVYFNEGKYNPDSKEGKHLLAHELTHTIQQKGMVQKKVQKSELSEKLETNWSTNKSKKEIFDLLSKEEMYKGRTDKDLLESLPKIFKNPDDLWVAKKILNRQLGESEGVYKKKALKLPIELLYFDGKSSQNVLIIAGVHGSEVQGIEVANLLKNDLASKQPHFNVILVPSLFPVNAKNRKREGTTKTNRNFPEKGKRLKDAKTDKKGTPLDAKGNKILIENQLLIKLIERFNPSRIISIHGTQYPNQAGAFSDPITTEINKPFLTKLSQLLASLSTFLRLYPDETIEQQTLLIYEKLEKIIENAKDDQTKQDEELSIETAKHIAKATNTLTTLEKRYKSSSTKKKVEVKFKKGSSKYKKALENIKNNPAVAGNKLEDPKKKSEWAGGTPGGISLGGYAPSHGISVFTIEPATNSDSGDYPTKKDKGISQADRKSELQAYADAIRIILLGK